MATNPYFKTYKTIFYIPQMLLKIFLALSSTMKSNCDAPRKANTCRKRCRLASAGPVHSRLGSQTLRLSSSPFLCTVDRAYSVLATQLNRLLGLKNAFFQGTSFNVDSSSRQNICSVETNK